MWQIYGFIYFLAFPLEPPVIQQSINIPIKNVNIPNIINPIKAISPKDATRAIPTIKSINPTVIQQPNIPEITLYYGIILL